jgi:Resolvase, N terminal domain
MPFRTSLRGPVEPLGASPRLAGEHRTAKTEAARAHVPQPDPLSGRRGKYLTEMASQRHRRWMNELLVGYARVSTEQQDLTAQRNGLHAVGVSDDRIYVDHGLTGTSRDRPGLTLALAACRAGDTC